MPLPGTGQRTERCRRDHLVRRDRGEGRGRLVRLDDRYRRVERRGARRALELQPRLRAQHRERVGVHACRRGHGRRKIFDRQL